MRLTTNSPAARKSLRPFQTRASCMEVVPKFNGKALGVPVSTANLIRLASDCESGNAVARVGTIWWALAGIFRSKAALEAENLVLRQQINVLRRTARKRPHLTGVDRLI